MKRFGRDAFARSRLRPSSVGVSLRSRKDGLSGSGALGGRGSAAVRGRRRRRRHSAARRAFDVGHRRRCESLPVTLAVQRFWGMQSERDRWSTTGRSRSSPVRARRPGACSGCTPTPSRRRHPGDRPLLPSPHDGEAHLRGHGAPPSRRSSSWRGVDVDGLNVTASGYVERRHRRRRGSARSSSPVRSEVRDRRDRGGRPASTTSAGPCQRADRSAHAGARGRVASTTPSGSGDDRRVRCRSIVEVP